VGETKKIRGKVSRNGVFCESTAGEHRGEHQRVVAGNGNE